jgi:PAS domain S-box-containing protein
MMSAMGSLSRDQALAILIGVQDRLDEAQKQDRARYADAFERAPRGVAVHELDERAIITRVNREELRVLGYAEEQLLGHHPWEFIVMNEVSQRAISQKLAGAKELKPFVRTFRHASGAAMTMLLVDRYRKDGQGRIVGLRTAFMEVGLEEPGGKS